MEWIVGLVVFLFALWALRRMFGDSSRIEAKEFTERAYDTPPRRDAPGAVKRNLRLGSKEQFKDWTRSKDYCVLGVVTTGRGDGAEILEIGIVDADGKEVFSTTILPEGRVAKMAMDRLGLSMDMLKDSPRWPEVHDSVQSTLDRFERILAYSADHDHRLLDQTAGRFGLSLKSKRWESVVEAYAPVGGTCWDGKQEFGQIPLDRAAKAEGVETGGPHRAVVDCVTTLRLIEAVASRI